MKMQIFCILAIIAATSGCRLLDKYVGNNDGKFDMPAIELILVGEDGEQYTLAYDAETGLVVAGKYVSRLTGLVYVADPDGTIEITDPRNGMKLRIKPVNQEIKNE